jgi:hypothetical protein
MIIFDFHEIAFAVPLLACSLSALVRRRPRAAAAWALPLVFVKEDQGLTVAAIGLVMIAPQAGRAWIEADGVGNRARRRGRRCAAGEARGGRCRGGAGVGWRERCSCSGAWAGRRWRSR